MEILDQIIHYWPLLAFVLALIGGAVKFYYDMRAVQARLSNVEQSLDQNYQNDTESKEEVSKKITELDNKMTKFSAKMDQFGKALKAILKELKIPDLL